MVRPGEPPDDLVVVVRATPSSLPEAGDDIANAARLSAEVYVLERDDKSRELLYGVSVYARRPGAEPDVLVRFSASPCFLQVTVGLLTAAGFPVVPTGADPDHFDVQLVPDRLEGHPADDASVMRAAARLVSRAGDLHANPFYAGEGEHAPEENT
jgi:hypothetical protein